MRRQATDWEKIFVKDVSDKESLSQIYKEFLKLKKLKKKKQLKMEKDLLSHQQCVSVPISPHSFQLCFVF